MGSAACMALLLAQSPFHMDSPHRLLTPHHWQHEGEGGRHSCHRHALEYLGTWAQVAQHIASPHTARGSKHPRSRCMAHRQRIASPEFNCAVASVARRSPESSVDGREEGPQEATRDAQNDEGEELVHPEIVLPLPDLENDERSARALEPSSPQDDVRVWVPALAECHSPPAAKVSAAVCARLHHCPQRHHHNGRRVKGPPEQGITPAKHRAANVVQ